MENDSFNISIENSKAPLIIRFGFLSVNNNRIKHSVALFCLIICSLQMIGIAMRIATKFLLIDEPGVFEILNTFSNYLLMDNLLVFTEFSWISIVLLFGSFSRSTHFVSLSILLINRLRKGKPIPDFMQSHWAVLNYINPLILALPQQCICLRIIKLNYEGQLAPFSDSSANQMVFAFAFIILIINFMYTVVLTKFFYLTIKTKCLTATKSNDYRFSVLLMKCIMSILLIIPQTYPTWFQYSIILLYLFGSLHRDFTLFNTLPFYRTSPMKIVVLFQALETCIGFLILVTKLAQGTYQTGIYFLLFSWVFFGPLFIKAYLIILDVQYNKVFSGTAEDLNPSLVMHKLSFTKEMLAHLRAINKQTKNLSLLTFKTYYKFIHLYQLDPNLSPLEMDQDLKKKIPILCTALISGAVEQHPKNSLLKLTLAVLLMKKNKSYLLANSVLDQVEFEDPSFSTHITSSWIRFELQRRLKLRYSSAETIQKENQLNMLKFVQMNEMSYNIRMDIIKQSTHQINFWNNYLSNDPNMFDLIQEATYARGIAKKLKRQWKFFWNFKSEQYKSPILTYATYETLVNNSITGMKLLEQYYNLVLKYKKLENMDFLKDETIFCQDVIQIRMSGSKKNLGIVLDCSQNIERIFGYEKEMIRNNNINKIMPKYYADHHDGFLLKHYETGKIKLSDRTAVVPVRQQNGYLNLCWLHIKLNPLVEEGVTFVGLLRPRQDAKRVVLVRERAQIDGMCKGFASDMGIEQKELPQNFRITKLCPDFKEVHEAFERIAIKQMQEEPDKFEKDLKNRVTQHTFAKKFHEMEKEKERFDKILHEKSKNMSLTERGLLSDTSQKNEGQIVSPNYDFKRAKKIVQESQEDTTPNVQERSSSDNSVSPKTETRIGISEEAAQIIVDQYTKGDYLVFAKKDKLVDLIGANSPDDYVIYFVTIMQRVDKRRSLKRLTMEKINDPELIEKHVQKFKFKHNINGTLQVESLNSQTPREVPHSPNFAKSINLLGNLEEEKSFASEEANASEQNSNEDVSIQINQRIFVNSTMTSRIQSSMAISLEPRNRVSFPTTLNIPSYPTINILDTSMIRPNGQDTSRPLISGREETVMTSRPLITGREETMLTTPGGDGMVTDRTDKGIPFIKVTRPESLVTFQDEDPDAAEKEVAKGKTLKNNQEKSDETPEHDNEIDYRIKQHQNVLRYNEKSMKSSLDSKLYKLHLKITEVLESKELTQMSRMFNRSIFFITAMAIIISMVQLIYGIGTLNNINTRSTAIQSQMLQIDSIVRINERARILQAVSEDLSTISGNYTKDLLGAKSQIQFQLNRLKQTNNQLLLNLPTVDSATQAEFFQKNVLTNGTLDTAFQAISRILVYGYSIPYVVYPSVPTYGYQDTNAEFIGNNCLNDLLISCENDSQLLISQFNNNQSTVRQAGVIIITGWFAVLAVYLIVITRYALIVSKENHFFNNILFKMDNLVAMKTKFLLEGFTGFLKKNYQEVTLLRKFEELEEAGRKFRASIDKKSVTRKYASMEKMNKRTLKRFCTLFPLLSILSAILSINFGYTNRYLSEIASQQASIQQSLQLLYEKTLIPGGLLEIVVANGTTNIRNEPSISFLNQELSASDPIQNMINNFEEQSNTDGTSIEYQIFFNYSCNQLTPVDTELYTQSELLMYCQNVSQSTGIISLTGLSSEMYSIISKALDDYESSNKNRTTIYAIFEKFITTIVPSFALIRNLLTQLYLEIDNNFQNLIDEVRIEAIIMLIVMLLFSLKMVMLTWRGVTARITLFELERRHVLHLLPVSEITSNQFIKHYLIDHSFGMLAHFKGNL